MNVNRRITIALILLVGICLGGALGYKILSPDSKWIDCLYMTVSTLATVGYGEVVPVSHSTGLKIYTMWLIMGGMGVVLYVLSTTTAFIVEGDLTNYLWRRRMDRAIERLQQHTIVCGTGETALVIIHELIKMQNPFVVVESQPERIAFLRKHFPQALLVEGDATDDDVLEEAGIERARCLISVLHTDRDNLMLIITARALSPELRIVASAVEEGVRTKFERAGANAVVSPNHIGGLRMVSEAIRPSVVSFLDRMLRDEHFAWRVEELAVPEKSPWIGRSLSDLDLRRRFNLQIMACSQDRSNEFTYLPDDSTKVRADFILVVLGEAHNVQRAREAMGTG